MNSKHDWNSGFLKNENNKKDLFSFISEEIFKKDLGEKLLLRFESVLSNIPFDVSAIWLPDWTQLDDYSKAWSFLLHCGCEKSCTGNCNAVEIESASQGGWCL